MKRNIIILLILIAVPLYIWNIYMIVGPRLLPGEVRVPHANTTNIQLFNPTRSIEIRFEKPQKSPLVAVAPQVRIVAPEPVVKKTVAPPVVAPPPVAVNPPQVVITGIMWNATNPVAMVRWPDGSSGIAKVGDVSNGITILAIEKDRIQVRYSNTEFWINR